MDSEKNFRNAESVFSKKVKAGKRRTYFFDVRQTKGNDYYLTLTESTRRFNGEGYDRHKIFLYKEDFNRFVSSLQETVDHVKTELMPDYDYDEFTRKHEEWEANRAAEAAAENSSSEESGETEVSETVEQTSEASEDDMSW
ncbi:MAG: DUF3276 family protein [Saprospiraceae bacterium]|nr:DUF3276 family protein [Saprospiraceae bacterium]